MKIAFFSNYLSHHQLPFSESMFKLIGENYTFVACEPFNKQREKMGWKKTEKKSYELRPYECEEDYEKALELTKQCDIMIWGSAKYDFIESRIKSGKVCVRYSERLLKKGFISSLLSLDYFRFIKLNLLTYSKNSYLFSSSAFAPFDFFLTFGIFKEVYKWGYFPYTSRYEIDFLKKKKSNNKEVKILWVGRLIELKHPEVSTKIAARLDRLGIPFNMKIIGNGLLENKLRCFVIKEHLNDKVQFMGALTPEEVRSYMEESDIFLFTSDYNEGWGAVLNEAMNSGCIVFCNDEIGSSRYLLENGKNGFLYSYGDIDGLTQKLCYVIKDLSLYNEIGYNAYNTIVNLWSDEIAAKRFYEWCRCILCKKNIDFRDGPLSKAKIIIPGLRWWFR